MNPWRLIALLVGMAVVAAVALLLRPGDMGSYDPRIGSPAPVVDSATIDTTVVPPPDTIATSPPLVAPPRPVAKGPPIQQKGGSRPRPDDPATDDSTAGIEPNLCELESQDDAELAVCRLPEATAGLSAPQKAVRDQTVLVSLVVHRTMSSSRLMGMADSIARRPAGSAQSARVRMSNRMGAVLSGQGFEITPDPKAPPVIQRVIGSDTTIWSWEVTPRRRGAQELTMTLLAYVGNEPRPYVVMRRQMNVRVTTMGWISDAGSWLTSRWAVVAYILSGIALLMRRAGHRVRRVAE